MIGHCIRSEPRLKTEDYTPQNKQETSSAPFVPKKGMVVVTPTEIPVDMIDLELGLNRPNVLAYKPIEMPKKSSSK